MTAPRAKLEPPAIPLREPEWLLNFTPRSVDLGQSILMDRWAWAAAVLVGPIVALGWFVAWRRIYPDAVRLARMRRTRAARRASEAIRRSARAPDPAGAVGAAVLGYLRARFPLPLSATTPGEISAGLRELGLENDFADAVEGFFHDCDAARFAPAGDHAAALAGDAQALIARLEAA